MQGYLVDAKTLEFRRLISDLTVLSTDWSPDGRRLAFSANVSRNSDIYLLDPDGSNLRRLTMHPAIDTDPTWSPDGRQIAFATNRDGDGEVYVIYADRTGLRNLTNHPANDGSPDWYAPPLYGVSPAGRAAVSWAALKRSHTAD